MGISTMFKVFDHLSYDMRRGDQVFTYKTCTIHVQYYVIQTCPNCRSNKHESKDMHNIFYQRNHVEHRYRISIRTIKCTLKTNLRYRIISVHLETLLYPNT